MLGERGVCPEGKQTFPTSEQGFLGGAGGGAGDSFVRVTRCANQTSRFWTDVGTQREHGFTKPDECSVRRTQQYLTDPYSPRGRALCLHQEAFSIYSNCHVGVDQNEGI